MATRVFALSDIHVDYDVNFQWVRNLSHADYRDDILILAGDVTHKLSQLASCLNELATRFAKVLFVPGNHDVWVLGEAPERTSLQKFADVVATVERSGASMQPHRQGDVLFAPLLSWYDYSFGEPSRDLYGMWMDFHACRWPAGFGPKDVATHFMDQNQRMSAQGAAKVITFSHFLPRIDLIPAHVPSRHRLLDPVLGSTRIEQQLRQLGSSIHVYGHSHINRCIGIDGVTYINNAFGSWRGTHRHAPAPLHRRAMTPSRSETLAASEHHIDVWLAYYHDIADPRLHEEYRSLLTEAERGKEFRFYFADDQRRYLVTRAMVRTVLSRYFHVPPTDWRFANNRYGRPEISNLSRDECGLCFNISHTKGLIALGVTHRRELGVDVENLRTREVSLDIADRFFAKPEVEELATVPPERQQDRFFEYWTFKESYIKARGMGLSLPLGQFSFHYPHERAVNIAIDPTLGDDANRWSFWQYRPTAEYLMAVCAEKRVGGAPSLTLRNVVPLLSEHLVESSLLKSSECMDTHS